MRPSSGARRRPSAPLAAILTTSVAALAACIPSQRSSFREGRPLTSASFGAAELAAVHLDADVGDVEVRSTDADSVRVEVTLRSSDEQRLARECLPNASLDARTDGGVLAVRLEQRTRNRCGARWAVTLPARLAVRVRADVGGITVAGLAGPIDVETRNGNLDVRSRAPSHGRIEVTSDVGRVSVRVRGYDIPAASRRGSGQEATVRGAGGPDLSLRTRIGRATLVIEDGA